MHDVSGSKGMSRGEEARLSASTIMQGPVCVGGGWGVYERVVVDRLTRVLWSRLGVMVALHVHGHVWCNYTKHPDVSQVYCFNHPTTPQPLPTTPHPKNTPFAIAVNRGCLNPLITWDTCPPIGCNITVPVNNTHVAPQDNTPPPPPATCIHALHALDAAQL